MNIDQAAVLQSYNDILKACNALDYRDLISCSAKLLTDFSEGCLKCSIIDCNLVHCDIPVV